MITQTPEYVITANNRRIVDMLIHSSLSLSLTRWCVRAGWLGLSLSLSLSLPVPHPSPCVVWLLYLFEFWWLHAVHKPRRGRGPPLLLPRIVMPWRACARPITLFVWLYASMLCKWRIHRYSSLMAWLCSACSLLLVAPLSSFSTCLAPTNRFIPARVISHAGYAFTSPAYDVAALARHSLTYIYIARHAIGLVY